MIDSLNRDQLKALLGRTDQSIDIRVQIGELPKPTIYEGKEQWSLNDKRIGERFAEFHGGEEMTQEDVRAAYRSGRPATQPVTRDLTAELEKAKTRAKELEVEAQRNGGLTRDFVRVLNAKAKVKELEKLMQGGE